MFPRGTGRVPPLPARRVLPRASRPLSGGWLRGCSGVPDGADDSAVSALPRKRPRCQLMSTFLEFPDTIKSILHGVVSRLRRAERYLPYNTARTYYAPGGVGLSGVVDAGSQASTRAHIHADPQHLVMTTMPRGVARSSRKPSRGDPCTIVDASFRERVLSEGGRIRVRRKGRGPDLQPFFSAHCGTISPFLYLQDSLRGCSTAGRPSIPGRDGR